MLSNNAKHITKRILTMVNKLNNKKAVKPTMSPVSSALKDELNKSNAKRGVPLPADLSGLTTVVTPKRGGTKSTLRDEQVLSMTQYGLEFYKRGVMQAQLHNVFAIIHEAIIDGLTPTVKHVRDTWNSMYGSMVNKGSQDFDQVFFGKYKGVCFGSQSWNVKDFKASGRQELAHTLTGNKDGICQLLMVA